MVMGFCGVLVWMIVLEVCMVAAVVFNSVVVELFPFFVVIVWDLLMGEWEWEK